MAESSTIPGYTFGSPDLPASPVTIDELKLLVATLLWSDDDERALRQAGDVLADQVDEILDLWYGYVGSHPHLIAYFAGPDGTPDEGYLQAVRARFGQWILDTCRRPFDQAWLDYQHEIALRHTTAKKNRTDGVQSTADHISLRYLVAFIWPITATVREFLARKGHPAAEVDAMHQAWFKAVVLSVALWSRPYAVEEW